MYIKKIEGPRTVRLPDGSVMSRADLPHPDCARWVVSRKLAVVRAVEGGLISRAQACETYGLSDEELDSWISGVSRHGKHALRATAAVRPRPES